MYLTLKDFIFAGKQWKRGAVLDAATASPSRWKLLEQARFIVCTVETPKKAARIRKDKK